MTDTTPPINRFAFYCNKCDYKCSKQNDYNKHCRTIKHNTDGATYPISRKQTDYSCVCGNSYKHRQSLHTHKKQCITYQTSNNSQIDDTNINVIASTNQPMDMTLVLELLKQNQEFKDLMVEQSKQLVEQQQQLIEQQHQNSKLLEAVKDGKLGSTINNTTNNNKFNLNVFLNETCKDAITMDDFIKSFEVTREDFIRTGNVGFIEGISTVMLSRFRNMETHTRPLHCTDLKRETVYIKNADKWEKEDANKTQLRRAVKVVAHRNMNELWRWYNDNKPEVEQIGTDECENYFKYYKAALGGCGKEEDLKFEEKIIKNVLKEVQVDKNMLTISD